MRRRVRLAPLVALVLFACVGIDRRAVADAQDGAPAHPCGGAWAIAAEMGPDRPPLPLLFTFAADGTALGSLPNPRRGVPGGADLETEVLEDSGMHGAWEATGERSCAITVRFFTSSAEGEFLVTTTLSAALEVDLAGDALSAETTLVDLNAAGEEVGSLSVAASGARIAVEPLLRDAPGVGTPSA